MSGTKSASTAVSPNDTVVLAGSTSAITDNAGHHWTISSTNAVLEDGTAAGFTANVAEIAYANGTVWHENTTGQWYVWTGSAWAAGNDPLPITTTPTASPDDTVVLAGSTSTITDAAGHHWTVSSDNTVLEDGEAAGFTANVAEIAYASGTVWHENTGSQWYSWTGSGWTLGNDPLPTTTPPAPTSTPVTTGSGSDVLVLSLSEDAYRGDAHFRVAIDGQQLGTTFTATASHASGASQSFTFRGDWAIGRHTVALNFLNDAYGGSPSLDRNLYVNSISYDGTNTTQSTPLYSTGAKSFVVTDATAVPSPPAITIGTGSDSLVLAISEDEYLGDAQFTVAVDGKQLGGICTTTASYVAGASQKFTFNGDWAVGTHSVTVRFSNDTYAGTPGTDRNLYVSSIAYDGTATGQSAALMAAGAKTFSVADITPIPAATEPIASPNDTVVLAGSTSTVTDDAGHHWTISSTNTVLEDGTAAGFTANVAEIAYANGTVWHENTTSQWYAWTGSAWAAGNDPLPANGTAGTLSLSGYHLTFDWEANDFQNNPTPQAGKFATTLSDGLRYLSNGDQEYRADSSTGQNPFEIDSGALDINATYVGAGNTPDGGSLSYISGVFTTQGSFSQQYGYFEMRAQLPSGVGMWPAFWMLDNTSNQPGGWPPELDVLEAFGAPNTNGEGGTNQAHWDAHSQNASQQAGGWATLDGNECTGFHTYGVLWTPTKLSFIYDGKIAAETPAPSDYTQKMYMIVNLAVGGTWPGYATGENGTMKVDYLRAFSSDSSVPAVSLQSISSPDSGGTSLYGASFLSASQISVAPILPQT